MRNRGLLLCLLALAGCEGSSEAGFVASLEELKGKPETVLLNRYGVPDATYSANGDKYLSYRRSRSGTTPGVAPRYYSTVVGNAVYTHPVGGVAPRSYSRYCNIDFRVTNGTVGGYRWEGNGCF